MYKEKMPSFDQNRLRQVRKSQISANYSVKHAINKIYGFDLLAVNNLRVYLGRFYVGVAEQLARGIKVCAQCQHHRCEAVPRRMGTH